MDYKTPAENLARGKPRARKGSRKVQQQIDWRRNKLSDYLVKGMSLPDISRVMNIPYDTLYKDQCILEEQARKNMRNHISDLPLNIKQATDGLNKLISMLYDIAAPSSLPLLSDIDNTKKTSDHVRVMAMSLIKDCMKEKIEILTSQAAITHVLDFVEKTKQQVKEQSNQDMHRVTEQDKTDSAAINDAIENNPEIQSSSYNTAGSIHHTHTQSSASSEQDQEEEEFAEQEDFEAEEEEEEEQPEHNDYLN